LLSSLDDDSRNEVDGDELNKLEDRMFDSVASLSVDTEMICEESDIMVPVEDVISSAMKELELNPVSVFELEMDDGLTVMFCIIFSVSDFNLVEFKVSTVVPIVLRVECAPASEEKCVLEIFPVVSSLVTEAIVTVSVVEWSLIEELDLELSEINSVISLDAVDAIS